MKLKRSVISKLNDIAQEDLQKAMAMLDGINLVLDTKYGWMCSRVVYFDNPDDSTCMKYRGVHDAWVNAED